METVKLMDGTSVPKVVDLVFLHEEVVVAYVRGDGPHDFAAYVYPVPRGILREEAELLWREKGSKLNSDAARAVFPNLFDVLTRSGRTYRA